MGGSESTNPPPVVTPTPPKEIVYVLELAQEKYYVGRTEDLDRRYPQHLAGEGAEWTKKYRPLRVLITYPATSRFDEDKYVYETMAKYGVENVRGGSYSNIVLTAEQKSQIERTLRGSSDRCFECGQAGHFVKNCPKLAAAPAPTPEEIPTEKLPTIETLTDPRDIAIFESLKKWRSAKSKELDIEAYRIFTNATLTNLAYHKPKTLEDLIRIPGVGEKKRDQFGSDLTAIFRAAS